MSTKTTFKRIALVAVAALGLGVLSVAPSSATVVTNTLTIDAATDTAKVGETATAVLSQSFLTGATFDSVTVTAALTSQPTGASATPYLNLADSSTGDGSLVVISAASNFATATGRIGSASASKGVNGTWTLGLYNPTLAGTYVVTVYTTPSNAGAAAAQATGVAQNVLTWTVTVSNQDKASAGSSTATLREGSPSSTSPFGGTLEGTDSSVVVAKSSTGATAGATLYVRLKNATSTADETITAVVTGQGYICSSNARCTNTALTLKSADPTPVYIFSNGTAGTATVTASTPSVSLGSHVVTFYGAAASLAVSTATAPKKVVYTKAGTSTAVATIKVLDANGAAVKNLAATDFTVTSSDALQIASGSVAAYSSTAGGYVLTGITSTGATSGKSTTLTVSIADPADTTGVKKLSTTHAVTMGGAASKEVISFDKASYTPGEQMIITVKATDASGNPVYDGASAPTLSSNKTLQGLAALTAYYAGEATSKSLDVDNAVLNSYTVYAPATAGEFKVTATGTDALGTLLSATASVSDAAIDAAADAANEATDAANAATDAALAAADAADAATAAAQDASDAVAALSATVAKLVASLKAQITSLTNLVIKIQKKVRA
jgi:protocatechuate 3,4-dioxygenase beta subunit